MLARFRKIRGEDGFTLIEMLVVILIIGILIAIGIPAYLGVRNRGYDASAQSDLKNAATGAIAYYEDHDEVYTGMTDDILNTSYVGGGVTLGAANKPTVATVGVPNAYNATLTVVSKSNTTFTATLNRTQITITP